MKIKYIDLFSGCGGFPLGLHRAGYKFGVHLYSEIDKYKIYVYRKHYPNSINIGDIKNVNPNEIISRYGNFDLVSFGWPCQDISILRKGKGLVGGPRSRLFFDAIRILEKIQPGYFIAENVAGLRNRKKSAELFKAIGDMSFVNKDIPQYNIEMQLLNSIYFTGQSRPRLYFIGQNSKNRSVGQIFPIEKKIRIHCTRFGVLERKVVACLTSRYGDSGATTTDTIVFDGRGFRGLMPVEFERFQGFPDEWTANGIDEEGSERQVSDRQRYRMLGDAVTVPIVTEIALKLKELINKN